MSEPLDFGERSGCDAAVLDVNLGSATSAPIAQRLSRAGVPFFSITGDSNSQLPAEFMQAPLISKPFSADRVIDGMRQCLGSA